MKPGRRAANLSSQLCPEAARDGVWLPHLKTRALDLKMRRLDLKTRRLDLKTRALDLKTSALNLARRPARQDPER